MAGRCFEGVGGLDSDDDHADTASLSATAAAAAAHYGAVTAAAIAGSVQGSSRTPRSPWGMSSPGGKAWQAPPAETIYVPPCPPTQRGWQSPQASSRGAATMVPKPKIPSTTGAGSSNTAALVAAARSTAAAVEQLAKLASDKAKKPACPVSSVHHHIGATLPVLDHATAASSAQPKAVTSAASAAASAASSAQPKAKAVTFAGRYPPPDPQRRSGWDNMVRDYHKQRAENNKRKMSQEKWYTLHAADYGQKVRKTVMKKPACPVSSDVGAGGDAGAGGDGAGGEEESPRVDGAGGDDGAGPDEEGECPEKDFGDDGAGPDEQGESPEDDGFFID